MCSAEYLAKRLNSRCCGWRCQKRAQRAGYLPPRKVRVVRPPPEAPSPAVETELTAADRFHSALGQQALLLASRTQPARRRWRNDIHRTSPGRSVRASWMAGPPAFDP